MASHDPGGPVCAMMVMDYKCGGCGEHVHFTEPNRGERLRVFVFGMSAGLFLATGLFLVT